MRQLTPAHYEITHASIFCGSGGGSLGFNRGHARVGRSKAMFRCLGGIDSWAPAVESFSRIVGTPCTLLDLFERSDYIAYHGKEPPKGWREATVHDVRNAFGGESPDVLFSSPPCKGFSGLLNPLAAASPKYQALDRLVVRGLALVLEAFADDLPAFVLLENVPRIATRGRELLDTICSLLRAYGYAVTGGAHNCGELGGLGQNRHRYLLVARNTRKVRPFLYEPRKQRVRSIGDVLADLPLPETGDLGPMHRLPRLTWQTWVRLALIPAGRDWKALNDLAVVDGYLRDIGIIRGAGGWNGGVFGVKDWSATACTVTGHSSVTCGANSVADPRIADAGSYSPYGIVPLSQPSRTVTGQSAAGSGPYSIPDPRLHAVRHNNVYRLIDWRTASAAITAGGAPSAGGLAVADPRCGGYGDHAGKMHVQQWGDGGRTVTGSDRVGSGAGCIADPRVHSDRYGSNIRMQQWSGASHAVICQSDIQTGAGLIADPRVMLGKATDGHWSGGGHYGCKAWADPSDTVVAKACHDSGRWTVADPRGLPAADDRPDPPPLIVALDQTWHRPLTTLELALLQGYPLHLPDGQLLSFAGKADATWREQIGNSVPPPTAEAIAGVIAEAMLGDHVGETFTLRAEGIWVSELQALLSMQDMGVE